MEYPGVYSGPIVTPSSPSVSAALYGFAPQQVMATMNISLPGAEGSPYCVRFSHSGGGSKLVCGNSPEAYFPPDPNGGSVTACLVAIEDHSVGGGPYCDTSSY
jgi:hypothetical protein